MYDNEVYLAHFQVLGAKHGHRRYQNYDGSLTPLGREHYGVGPPRGSKEAEEEKKSSASKHIEVDANTKKKLQDVKDSFKKLKERAKAKQEEREQRFVEKAKKRIEEAEQSKKEQEAREAEERALKEQKHEEERKAIEEAELSRERLETEALKQYYREHPLQIYSARDKLSPEDLKDVQNNIKLDNELRNFRRDQLLRYVRTADDIANAIGTAYKGADNMKKLYNIGVETYNAFVAAKDPNDEKKPLRKIGDGKNEKDTSGKKKPDYIEKIGDRYFYDKAELAAYKAHKSTADKVAAAYSSWDDPTRKKFEKELKSIYDKKVSNMSGSEKQKFASAFSSIEYVLKNEEGLDDYIHKSRNLQHSDLTFNDLDNAEKLAHHQRKGAKWGVMNGPPYPLDRQTVKDAYGSSAKPAKDAPDSKTKNTESSSSEQYEPKYKKFEDGTRVFSVSYAKRQKATMEAIEKYGNGAEGTPVDKINAVTYDCITSSSGHEGGIGKAAKNISMHKDSSEDRYIMHRAVDAAKLGIQALQNMGEFEYELKDYSKLSSSEKNGWIDWFIYEDQTIGCAMIADMIDRGYTAKQCREMIRTVERNYSYDNRDKLLENAKTATFEIREGNYDGRLERFAEECEKIKSKEDPKYLEKVKSESGGTRYIYDKDELKAFESMRNNAKTDEEKDRKVSKWERARDKDLWDTEFVEAVQNSKIMDDDNIPALLSEYASYIDDPDNYIKNRADKLKPA